MRHTSAAASSSSVRSSVKVEDGMLRRQQRGGGSSQSPPKSWSRSSVQSQSPYRNTSTSRVGVHNYTRRDESDYDYNGNKSISSLYNRDAEETLFKARKKAHLNIDKQQVQKVSEFYRRVLSNEQKKIFNVIIIMHVDGLVNMAILMLLNIYMEKLD